MGIEQVRIKPPKCFLANVESGESIECLFNPTELSEKVQVNWNRVGVPGLSHQLLQYQSTGNRQLAGVEFYLDKFFAEEQPRDVDILEFRGFLRALTVPPASADGVIGTAPPRVLFIWPEVVTIETILTELEFRYRQFASDGSLLVYTATVTFEEMLDVRVTSEERRSDR
jgi:hypothetical protein